MSTIGAAGRVVYIRGYAEAADKRHRGFAIQAFACGALFIGVLAGIIWRMVHGW